MLDTGNVISNVEDTGNAKKTAEIKNKTGTRSTVCTFFLMIQDSGLLVTAVFKLVYLTFQMTAL